MNKNCTLHCQGCKCDCKDSGAKCDKKCKDCHNCKADNKHDRK